MTFHLVAELPSYDATTILNSYKCGEIYCDFRMPEDIDVNITR
jgi:hypothetical protein